MKDRHVMEALGKTRVVVENGKVVEVGEPQTDYCPIFDKVRNIKQFTKESVKGNIEFRIDDFGMFTALRRNLLDSCVIACEGAGTVITSSPTLAQGIGSRISGLVEIMPLPELIRRIEEKGGTVLDTKTAALDQVAGVEKSIRMGHRRIAVSVISSVEVKKMKELEKEHDVEIITFGVHVTGIGAQEAQEAQELISVVDIITGCTSKHLRGQRKSQTQS
jgi:putative methanogenesis marker protein 8